MMVRLYFKKIFENKIRLFLNIINYALGMFLSVMAFTIGINLVNGISEGIQKHSYYLNVYISNLESDDVIDTSSVVARTDICSIEAYEVHIFEKIVSVSCGETTEKEDTILPGAITSGRCFNSVNEIMVSSNFADGLNRTPDEIIGINVTDGDGNNLIIVGVYQIDDSIYSQDIMKLTDEIYESDLTIFKLSSIDSVKKFSDQVRKYAEEVFDYSDEINAFYNYKTIIIVCFIIIGFGILLTSSILLYTSLRITIFDHMEYLSMLKALGYSTIKLLLFEALELLTVYILSILVTAIIYFPLCNILNTNVSLPEINKLIGAECDVFIPSFMIYVLVSFVSLSFIGLFLVKILSFIKKSDVERVLSEAQE